MVSASEGAAAKHGIASALAGGVETLSENDGVVFTKYVRMVLPLDGYVFWVKADLLSTSALLGSSLLNTTTLNKPQKVETSAATVRVKGSLHYATAQDQNEAETEGRNTVIFTAESPIQEFNDVQSNVLWIGTYAGDREGDDGPITFAFSQRGRYYKAADLFHYSGIAVLPVFKNQLIDSLTALSAKQLIVSNSLPVWLSLNGYVPPYPGFANPITLYPSFLIPDNLPPPYGAVHIEPSATEALLSAPYFDGSLSQYQLAHDKVRVTLYGLSNAIALTFLAAVEQHSYDYNAIGLMNMPIVKDEKRVQTELNVIAQKKTIDFDVSYNQATVRDLARQYIRQCIVDFEPEFLVSA